MNGQGETLEQSLVRTYAGHGLIVDTITYTPKDESWTIRAHPKPDPDLAYALGLYDRCADALRAYEASKAKTTGRYRIRIPRFPSAGLCYPNTGIPIMAPIHELFEEIATSGDFTVEEIPADTPKKGGRKA